MKLLSIMSALILAVPALAQSIQIGSPAPGAVLAIGKPYTVEVDKPDSQGATQSVSVVIGLQRCGNKPCVSSGDQQLGQILYKGDYKPARNASQPQKPPFQSFPFTLAADEKPQNAVIHVSHLYLLGAGPQIILETKNMSVTFA